MGACRIFKQGLIVVSIIFLSSITLSADVIPFDYFFGRITGGQHLNSIYQDGKHWQNSAMDYSFKGGAADLFQYDIGRFLRWQPTKDENRTTWRRNPLMGSFQVADGTRYYLNGFNWRDNGNLILNEPNITNQSNSSLWLDQSVVHLKNGSIRYKPEKSLHTYLQGHTLNKGDYLLNGSLTLRVDDSFSEYKSNSSLPPKYNTRESDSYNYQVRVFPEFGITDNLEGGIEIYSEKNKSNIKYIRKEIKDSVVNEIEFSFEGSNSKIIVSPMIQYFAAPNVWFKLSGQYLNRKNESKRTNREPDKISLDYWYFDLKNTWVSRNQVIPLQQILDNHNNYYTSQLESGTFVVNNHLNYRTNSYNQRVSKDLNIFSDIRFFVLNNLQVETNVNLDRRYRTSYRRGIVTYHHRQRYNIIAKIAYQSFTWDQNKRRDISWQEVSDIDYLLGPLLRPGDYKLLLMVDFPDNNWGIFNSNDGRLFNFFKGKFNKNWKVSTSASVGIRKTVQAGVEINWNQYEVHDFIMMPFQENVENYINLAHNWRLIPQVTVQPTDYLRLQAKLTELFISNPYYGYYYPEITYDVMPYPVDDHDWQIEFVVDLVI